MPESHVTVHNVTFFDKIQDVLLKSDTIKAIVFIDDIIASGSSAIAYLDKLNAQCGKILYERNIIIVVGVICGFSLGVDKLEKELEKFNFKIKYKICDYLNEEDQCFSNKSRFFDSDADREHAKSIAFKHGCMLQKLQPLGFNDCQLAVVFHDNCPNNTLPIIWSKSNNDKWTPLFKRN